jgi:hypothetical protein
MLPQSSRVPTQSKMNLGKERDSKIKQQLSPRLKPSKNNFDDFFIINNNDISIQEYQLNNNFNDVNDDYIKNLDSNIAVKRFLSS